MSKETVWVIVIAVVLLIVIFLLSSRSTQAAPPGEEKEGGGMWSDIIGSALEGIGDLTEGIGPGGSGKCGKDCRGLCKPLKGARRRKCKRACKSDCIKGIDIYSKYPYPKRKAA